MFSGIMPKMDLDQILENFKEPEQDPKQLDVVVEGYLAKVNQLQGELAGLREELTYHRKVHGEISNSLDEFFTIQRLSSIITQSLEFDQIIHNLDDIAQKVIPHFNSEMFLMEDDKIKAVRDIPNADFVLLIENMMEEGILEWLWEQGHPIVVPIDDFMVCERLTERSGNLVVAPILMENSGRGAYLLRTDKSHSQFSFRDLELLNILTQQAAIAMQYTKLFKKLENTHDALKNSQTRLMQTIKLATVGELAGGIAHEINNPLQIILGNIQMAMMGYKTDESLKIVETQAMRIANIVRGLLSMSRQKTSAPAEFLEINPLIMNTLNLVRGQIEKRAITIETKMADKLPIVQGSSIYFQQIILNFLLHSKKQIEQSGSIIIKTEEIPDYGIQIELEDSGVAMPAEYIKKIMDPFDDLENSTEMNLGLTVSVQMIRDIGGKIWFESGEVNGNKVILQIPKMTINGAKNEKEVVSSG